ncbi:succinate-semialdehyde dehydrogenase (NADP(+)), partial [Pseudomonas sp. 39004]|nr:succinate-semialdehyde dehydrogenase (NADP(+)) [Pseudomonas sp. 39004]
MKLADRDLLREMCYIDGKWQAADSGQRIAVTNPANGEVLGYVPRPCAAHNRSEE